MAEKILQTLVASIPLPNQGIRNRQYLERGLGTTYYYDSEGPSVKQIVHPTLIVPAPLSAMAGMCARTPPAYGRFAILARLSFQRRWPLMAEKLLSDLLIDTESEETK